MYEIRIIKTDNQPDPSQITSGRTTTETKIIELTVEKINLENIIHAVLGTRKRKSKNKKP